MATRTLGERRMRHDRVGASQLDPELLLAPDAAGLVDPLSSRGIFFSKTDCKNRRCSHLMQFSGHLCQLGPMRALLLGVSVAKTTGRCINRRKTMQAIEVFQIRDVDGKLLERERNRMSRRLRRILPATAIVEVGSTAVQGVVGKQDLDFLVKVPRGRFLRTREILDRAFERDRRQHSDHEFQGYCLPSTISGAIQLTVKDGRYDVFERFLEVLRAKPEVRRAYNELKRDWNLRSMNGYRATKAAFIKKALKEFDN